MRMTFIDVPIDVEADARVMAQHRDMLDEVPAFARHGAARGRQTQEDRRKTPRLLDSVADHHLMATARNPLGDGLASAHIAGAHLDDR